MTYCELGSGQGVTANLLAAANPEMEIYATDFNPKHAYNAQELARVSQLSNVHFFDNSFAEFEARNDLPQFNVIALHGIYTWVSQEHRQTIIRFIEKRLKPGGLVYISYNCLPGWAGISPIRHLIQMHAERGIGSLPEKIDAALAFIERFQETDARYFKSAPSAKERFERIKSMSRNYIAHEYLNKDWTLFYHSEIVADLSQAKLSYIGPANILDNVDSLNLTKLQIETLKEATDPVMYETLRDYMINQQFRKDVFARGAIPLSLQEARREWLDTSFTLVTHGNNVPMKLKVPLGEVALEEKVYRPIIDAFEEADGSASLGQAVRKKAISSLGWARLQQALLTLIGTGYLQPSPPVLVGDTKRRESARNFNNAVILQACHSDDLKYLASPITGGGVAVSRLSQLFLLAIRKNEKDPISFVWSILKQQNYKLSRDGNILDTDEENLSFVKEKYESFQKGLPTLQRLGLF